MSVSVLRVLVVDDEPIARERMCLLCAEVGGVQVVGSAGDGRAGLDGIAALSPDLVLLDIAMPGLDGLAVASAISSSANRPAVIFCTAHDRYALAAFDVSAVDYLLKPVSRARFAEAIEKARRSRSHAAALAPERRWPTQLWAPHRGAMVRIAVQDLDRVDAERDYVRLWTGRTSYLLHESMIQIEGRLDPAVFVRLRRSSIVRRDLIRSLRHEGLGVWVAVLADGAVVRIGPTYLPELKALLRA